MKKLILLSPTIFLIGCSNVTNIGYEKVEDGCIYSETIRPRKYLFDYFGRRDYDLHVKYAGITCQEMVQHEVRHSIHKTPYNGIDNINEIPAIKVDVQ